MQVAFSSYHVISGLLNYVAVGIIHCNIVKQSRYEEKELAQDRGEWCYMSDYAGFSQLSLTYIKLMHVTSRGAGGSAKWCKKSESNISWSLSTLSIYVVIIVTVTVAGDYCWRRQSLCNWVVWQQAYTIGTVSRHQCAGDCGRTGQHGRLLFASFYYFLVKCQLL